MTASPEGEKLGRPVSFLLDEHYPPILARSLAAQGVDAVAIIGDRPHLTGASDARVLAAAAREGRVVVTEDVSTFALAVQEVPAHVGVVYCRSRVFQRTGKGLARIERALRLLAKDPPPGLGSAPLSWWLADPEEGGAAQHQG
jgi:predicted nuclease of predicted toxin-antitoxin system